MPKSNNIAIIIVILLVALAGWLARGEFSPKVVTELRIDTLNSVRIFKDTTFVPIRDTLIITKKAPLINDNGDVFKADSSLIGYEAKTSTTFSSVMLDVSYSPIHEDFSFEFTLNDSSAVIKEEILVPVEEPLWKKVVNWLIAALLGSALTVVFR
jgi:hypothetical protein